MIKGLIDNGAGRARAGWAAWAWGLGALAVAVALPPILQAREMYHIVHTLCLIGIYVLLAQGLNIIIGYTGILNLGYAAFYGIGAYTAAMLSVKFHMPFWALLPICGLVAAGSGVLLGMPTLRLRGDYIAIVTLGFVEIVRLGLNNMDSITNGPKGLPRVNETIPTPQLSLAGHTIRLDGDIPYYYFILLLVLLTLFVVSRLHNSRTGRSWVAIREDEAAAEAMGVNTTLVKIQAFAAGTFFAGVAGCVYTHWVGFITPELFTFWESVLIVCMIVLGGMGNIYGVVLGTVLIVGIPEILRDVLQAVSENISAGSSAVWSQRFDNIILARMLIFGVIMIVMVIFRTQGILPARRPRVAVGQPGPDTTREGT
jgi:branched-chain amino acid transport system permease protein